MKGRCLHLRIPRCSVLNTQNSSFHLAFWPSPFQEPYISRFSSSWGVTLTQAKKLVEQDSFSFADPMSLVDEEMTCLTTNIRFLLGSKDILLDQVSKYYVRDDGAKHLRPLLVLLLSKAIPRSKDILESLEDVPLSPEAVLNDVNPSKKPIFVQSHILPSQRRLAEITEMIHAASLLHDDVIDDSAMRRGKPSANYAFSNKMSILAGDFMLGRASVALARLRDPEVIELLATVLANLVEGEFMQLKNTIDEGHESTMAYYIQKTYLKTASLISKSCRATAILGGGDAFVVEAAYQYGRNLGLAFQVIDDMLDYTNSASQLGKPAGADLKLGLATAPILFAWQKWPELGPMIKRKFSHPGDVERAQKLTLASNGLEQTRLLAEQYCGQALAALEAFPESVSKAALRQITEQVLTRSK